MKNKQNETVIRVSDLFASILKAAKPILCATLAFALLGGLWGVYRVIDAAKHPTVTADDIKAAEKAVEAAEKTVLAAEKSLDNLYKIEIPDAETKIVRAKQLLQRRQEYIDNSLYYAMNPFHRGISRVSLFVDTDTPVNPNAPWMDVNPQASIVIAATRIYPFDSEILENIQQIMGTDSEMQYINELVSVTNISNQIVEIRVYYDDAEIAKQVTDYLLNIFQKRLSETVGNYSANVIGYFVGYEVDWAMNDSHNAHDDNLLVAERNVTNLEEALQTLKEDTKETREQALENANTALNDAETKLEDVKKQYSNTSADTKNIIKSGVKNAAVFFVLGFALCCFIVLACRAFSNKLQDISTVLSRYSFPIIGILPKKNRRWFEKTIRNLEGEADTDLESAGKIIAQNLTSVMHGEKLALVSSEGCSLIDKLLPFCKDLIPVCGDILKDADAVKSSAEYDAFVLVEERGKSRIDQIDSEVRRIDSLGKQVKGIIIF